MADSFDDAVRKMFGAPATATVSVEMEGGQEVGCLTCGGREEYTFTLHVWDYKAKRANPLDPVPSWHRTYTDLPALWRDLNA